MRKLGCGDPSVEKSDYFTTPVRLQISRKFHRQSDHLGPLPDTKRAVSRRLAPGHTPAAASSR